MTRIAMACGSVLFLAFGGPVSAQSKPINPVSTDHTDARAGFPQEISRRAVPTNNAHYLGGYIGGSKLFRGDGPSVEQGSFGWDYVGIGKPLRRFLGWANGRKVYPASNGYPTETLKVPNPLEQRIIRKPKGEGEGH